MNITPVQAAQALKSGKLVAFPTETVYGLGADAENEGAVGRIFATKGRPVDHPLIVHMHSVLQLPLWANGVRDYALALAEAFWPGPMTLILDRSDMAGNFVTGGADSVGLRVPSHPLALELLSEFIKLGGHGIAAPSANRFGRVSPTSAQAVRGELGDYLEDGDLVLDGGSPEVGIESTIIDCRGPAPKLLRPGSITAEMIEKVTGQNLDLSESTLRVSGSLENHYSPLARVLLDQPALPGDGFLAMANVETPQGVIRLGAPSTLEQFAQGLYQSLRQADELSLSRVVVWQPTGGGLAVAIRDRLTRASFKG